VERVAIDLAIRLGLLTLFVVVVALIVAPFLSILVWSATLTVALFPVYAWLRDRLGGRGLPAAALVTVLSLAFILGPIGLLSASLVDSLLRIAEAMKDRSLDLSHLREALASLPVVGESLQSEWSLATSDTGDFLKQIGHTVLVPSEWLLKAVAGLAGSTLVVAGAVAVSGFLFAPGPRIVAAIHDIAVRVVGPRGTRFVALAGATVRNVARGVVGIAALQALWVGIALLIAGVPHAGLLALAILVLAIVQVGTTVLIVPLILWIWMAKGIGVALLFALAMAPVAAAENLLKPMLLAKGLTTPVLVLAVGVIGGVVSLGLPGLFVGPIVLAVFYEMIVLWVWPESVETVDPDIPAP
jgi:predicted PurR-regulated permease PerM